jgi:hypothetical protein
VLSKFQQDNFSLKTLYITSINEKKNLIYQLMKNYSN